MNQVQHAKTVITVDKPLDEVKKTIHLILTIGSTYQLIQLDEYSHIYQIGVVEATTPVFLSVVLTKVSAGKTIIKVEAKAAPTATAAKKILENAVASLIAVIQKALSGHPVTSEMVQGGNKKAGRHWIVFVMAAIATIALLFALLQLA